MFWSRDQTKTKINLHAHKEEVVRDDLKKVLLVLAEQHQPEDRLVDGEPEEAFAVGAARETVISRLDVVAQRSQMCVLKLEMV